MRKILVVLSSLAIALAPAALMAQADAGGKYTVTFKVTKTNITQGQKVTLSGKVSPKAAGKTIKFQALLGSEGDETWTTVRTVKIKSNGKYSKKVTPFTGVYKWRAYKPAGSGHASGKSKAVTIKTYAWFRMANADQTELFISSGAQWLGRYGPIQVAGKTVNRYFATNQLAGDTTQWYTQNNCKRIRADVGLYDVSAQAAVGRFRIFANAKQIVSTRVPYGTSIAIDKTFSPKATGTIKFTGAVEGETQGVTAIVAANPRVLCTGINPDIS